MSESKSPRQRISSGLVFKIFDMRRGFIGMQVNDLLVEAQQPHGKGGSAEYANRKSDATTAATSAASAGDASRSMMSTTSDILRPLALRGRADSRSLNGDSGGTSGA
jgi:hypothetical protein